jgi:hypothetical protein
MSVRRMIYLSSRFTDIEWLASRSAALVAISLVAPRHASFSLAPMSMNGPSIETGRCPGGFAARPAPFLEAGHNWLNQ